MRHPSIPPQASLTHPSTSPRLSPFIAWPDLVPSSLLARPLCLSLCVCVCVCAPSLLSGHLPSPSHLPPAVCKQTPTTPTLVSALALCQQTFIPVLLAVAHFSHPAQAAHPSQQASCTLPCLLPTTALPGFLPLHPPGSLQPVSSPLSSPLRHLRRLRCGSRSRLRTTNDCSASCPGSCHHHSASRQQPGLIRRATPPPPVRRHLVSLRRVCQDKHTVPYAAAP